MDAQTKKQPRFKTQSPRHLCGRLDELAGLADGAALLADIWANGDERAAEIPPMLRSLCRQLAEALRASATEMDGVVLATQPE